MNQITDQRLFEQIRDALLLSADKPIIKIIVYGSRATGTASADSDFDVLVIEKGPIAKQEERRRLREVFRDFPYPVDVWVMSEEEFEETKHVVGGLAYPANRYGSVL